MVLSESEVLDELLHCSFIFVDKPRGPSSHEITTFVKKLLGAQKAGHAGTLDPQVSGVQIIGLNKAARLLRYVVGQDKEYIGVLRLRQAPEDIAHLQKQMDRLVGKIRQMPPKESAVAKRRRERKVYEFTALELLNRTALFRARVEAGTYVRVLCTDVGKAFGGGIMLQLRRTRVGRIGERRLVRLPDLADALYLAKNKRDVKPLQAMLVPVKEMLKLPCLCIRPAAVEAVCRGSPLAISDVSAAEVRAQEGQEMQLTDEDGKLVAIAQFKGGALHPKIVLCEREKNIT